MKKIFFFISFIMIFSHVYLKLTDEKRRELLSKLTKKISLETIDNSENQFNSYKNLKIDYDPMAIQNLISQYGFPEEYNFLEDINATVRVKDQQYCGCCWSHSSTSALAYRYQKLGFNIDLSPQHGLSCYVMDCDKGNYIIDSQLHLVKNGTVTEECLPFSSGDGETIEKCPVKCKDGTDLKKYYAQNAYMTQDYYSKDTIYDIILIIIDQLTTNGPVVTAIDVYNDFVELHKDPEKCHNEVYTYDGKSEFEGGHAITIVGYGLLKDKYYWLVQNSWGEEACDKGFVKIEFGQVGVEQVAFSDPYIPEEGITPLEIPVKFDNIDEECYIKVSTTSSYDKWKNTLDINFKNEKNSKEFNYQCSTTSIPGRSRQLKCYYDWNYYLFSLGEYKFIGSNTLGRENSFILDDSFNDKSFTFLGLYQIISFLGLWQNLYISENGSRILFYYVKFGEEGEKLNPIYPNANTHRALSDCHKIQMNLEGEVEEFVYCNINEEEINYFEYESLTQSDNPVLFDILCGYKENTYTIVYRLDKTKSPVFKIKGMFLPNKERITEKDELILNAIAEGSISNFKNADEIFVGFTNIEKNGVNSTFVLLCLTGIPPIGKAYNISCILDIENDKSLEYDDIYLLPYTLPYDSKYPYEIFINETIKGSKNYTDIEPEPEPEPQPEPDFSSYIKISLVIFISIFLLL